MKEFSRKLDKEETKFDPKCALLKSSKIQKKLMENVFQPIQCDKTDKLSGTDVGANVFPQADNDDFESILFSKNDKTIHESLRMSKTKRRKSLPSFEEPKESLESLSNIENENSKSYNISYYTSITKGKQSDTGSNEYYSSSLNYGKARKDRKDGSETSEAIPHKSVSDDYVYCANKSPKRKLSKVPTSASTDSVRQDCEYGAGTVNGDPPKRLSVTEPSSPASTYTSKYSVSNKILKMKNDNTESEDVSESESECHTTPIVSKIRKSKSFADQKASKKNYDMSYKANVAPLQAKNSKGNKVKARKLSRSSTSSCDSFCPSQSLRRNQKAKVNKAEIENTKPFKVSKFESNSLNYPSKKESSSKKKRVCACEEIEKQKISEHSGKGRFRDSFDKVEDVRNPLRTNRKPPEPRERVRSSSREGGKDREMPSSSRMNTEMYLHLLDVLLQKNQAESYAKDVQQQIFTKSLPRNHHKSKIEKHPARFPREFPQCLTSAVTCDKDRLKILRSVAADKPNGNANANRGFQKKNSLEYMEFAAKKKTANAEGGFQKGKFIETSGMESYGGRRTSESSVGRCGCAPYECYNSCGQQRKKHFPKVPGDAGKYKNEGSGDRIEKPGMNRGRTKNQRGNDEECVIRIEDEKLWIKICKAVEEVSFKEKNLRKSD